MGHDVARRADQQREPAQPPRPSDNPRDQVELGLLDKISAMGMDGLSADEKRRLNELSKRLRKSKEVAVLSARSGPDGPIRATVRLRAPSNSRRKRPVRLAPILATCSGGALGHDQAAAACRPRARGR